MGKFQGLDSLAGLFAHLRGSHTKDWQPLEVDSLSNLHVASSLVDQSGDAFGVKQSTTMSPVPSMAGMSPTIRRNHGHQI